MPKCHCNLISFVTCSHYSLSTITLPTVFASPTLLSTIALPAFSLHTGRDGYNQLRRLAYPDTDVFLICFSVDMPDSFNHIHEKWVPEVQHHCPNVPFLLVATKKDLRNDPTTKSASACERRKTIPTEQGQAMAEKINAYTYLECSAKTREGVREVFEAAARAALTERSERRNGMCALL